MGSTEIYNCENEDHNDSYGECLNCWGGKANRERDEWKAMADRLAEDLKRWENSIPCLHEDEPISGNSLRGKALNTIDAYLKLKAGK